MPDEPLEDKNTGKLYSAYLAEVIDRWAERVACIYVYLRFSTGQSPRSILSLLV
jgi:hypothetical protein